MESGKSRDLGSVESTTRVLQPSSHMRSGSRNWSNSETTWAGGGSVLDSAAVRNMVSAMGGYAMSALLDASSRQELREKCSERLREENGMAVQYAEQAVLANLDWGIDGLEKAVKASHPEIRAARLEHAEKMLQVAVLLDPKRATAGVSNSFLSAWAMYYMALVWKLRNSDRNAALHFLDMFLLEPSQARKTFAPALWEQLFRPHMANIEAWFQGELAQIMTASPSLSSGVMVRIPAPAKRRSNSHDFGAHSRTFSTSHDDFGDHSDFSPPPDEPGLEQPGETAPNEKARRHGLNPDQMMRMELLNKLYEDSLSENTQQYAQYYKDWLAYEDDNDGDSMQSSPALPRTINPSHSSLSFNKLQELASGQARPSGRSLTSGVANGGMPATGGGHVLQKRVSFHRHPSMDHEQDSFSEVSFTDAPAYSRNNSAKEYISAQRVDEDISEEIIEEAHEGSVTEFTRSGYLKRPDSRSGTEISAAIEGEEEEGPSFAGKGVGVYLDGEELREDELLQVWEELSEGRISPDEANDFLSRLTNGDGQAVSFKTLSAIAEALEIYQRSHQQDHGPAESASLYSKYSNSPESGMEDEEQEGRSWQESDRPPTRESWSRMNSMSSGASFSSRNNVFLQKTYSRQQSLMRPPKDFVCSITNQLFQDPVTLETGQTYERAAIKEWLDRGNTSCPITRQVLKNQNLPNTNYVLKRLVDNWKDEHPDYSQDLSSGEQSTSGHFESGTGLELQVFEGSRPSRPYHDRASMNGEVQPPSRRFGQKVAPLPFLISNGRNSPNSEDMLSQLESAVDTLFRADDFAQCERAVLVAMHIWVESKCDSAVASTLSKAGVVEGLMEVLSRSKKDEILKSVVCLLSELVTKDELTRHTIVRTDPDVESIVTILRNEQVPEVVVLLHLLKIPPAQVSVLEIVPFLVSVVKGAESLDERTHSMCMTPKAAAVYVLEQLVTTLDHPTNMANAEAIVIAEGVPSILERLESKALEEKVSAVAVLWSCLQAHGDCRMLMVQNLKMSTLVDLLHNSKEQARTVAIFFLAELIRLNRRSVIEKVLKDVLHEGLLNSMHVLMLHLQISPFEHRPLVANLLLQLDLLADPQKHSVYREEALEALGEALASEDNVKVQFEAVKVLASLSGRYSYSGKPLTEASLLKYAGLSHDHSNSGNLKLGASSSEMDQSWEDEEKAADRWDQRMALAVLGGGKSLIEGLGVLLPSKSSKMARLCAIGVAWLTCSLRQMADSTLWSYARNSLLPSLVSILQKGHDIEGSVLASLSLYNLTCESVEVQQLTIFAKDLLAPLRRLRRYTWTSKRILEALAANPSLDLIVEMWTHGEVGQLDVSQSGEIRSVLHFRGFLYTGHVDASIKVWNVKRRLQRMVQEVREHSRAVLTLASVEEESKIFSGSADKTVRIWVVHDKGLRCLQIIDVKEAVHSLAANSSFICVIPPGVGIKVFDSVGTNPRLLNSDKHVQSIVLGDNRIYCGCTDNSVQEVDPVHGTSSNIQSGTQGLRGKKSIYSMQLIGDNLYAAGMIVEGTAAKIWNLSTKSLVSSISVQHDVRVMAVSEDLIYLANNLSTGIVEVWSRADYQKVDTFQVGSKVLALSPVGETLYAGSADGKLRAYALI